MIFVGRLEASKSVDVLIRAVSAIRSQGERVRLLCVGDGPLTVDLRRLAAELAIEPDVVFWGSCYDEAVLGRLFHAADLTVSPGPVGLLAIHSLAYGTPVLISDAVNKHGPEFEAIEPGRTGATFREGSVESLAAETVRALRNLRKPEVSRDCISAVEQRYNPATQAELITSVIEGVLGLGVTEPRDRVQER